MSNYEYFTEEELKCKCGCALSNPNPEFHKLMLILDSIRRDFNQPLPISSAYRCRNHPIEAAKALPGQHNKAAVDIQVAGSKALRLLRLLVQHPDIKGVGIQQNGSWNKRFIHIDLRQDPTIWSYK